MRRAHSKIVWKFLRNIRFELPSEQNIEMPALSLLDIYHKDTETLIKRTYTYHYLLQHLAQLLGYGIHGDVQDR